MVINRKKTKPFTVEFRK